MKRESWFSLLSILIGLALQGTAWILDNAPRDIRILLTILSLLPSIVALLLQGAQSQGLRAWSSAFVTFLRANSSLAIIALLSAGVLIVLPRIPGASYLSEVSMSIAVVLLSVSVFTLIRGLGAQPSLRVVKGSTDACYLVKNGVKRLIPDSLTLLFVLLDTYRGIECVSDMELALYREGQQLPSVTSCRLVKGSGRAIYVVWEGHRKHIPDSQTYDNFFSGRSPERLSDVDLEAIPRTGALRSVLSLRPMIAIGKDEVLSVGVGKPK